MRTMIRSVLVSVLLGFLTVVAAQRTPSCEEEWNTKEYFQTATVEDVTACLDAGADLEARDLVQSTPLHEAAEHNENPAVLKALLAAGADLMARNYFGNTPLHEAAEHNENPAVIQALIDAGADPKVRARVATRLCIWRPGSTRVQLWFEVLLASGADSKAKASDENDHTPLHEAAANNANPDVFKALLAAGADLKTRDEGWSSRFCIGRPGTTRIRP